MVLGNHWIWCGTSESAYNFIYMGSKSVTKAVAKKL